MDPRQSEPTDTWSMSLVLSAPGVNPAAVQWSLLSTDPRIGYEPRLAQIPERTLEREGHAPSVRDTASSKAWVWDQAFRHISGVEVHLAIPGLQLVMADCSGGAHWLVTKAVRSGAHAFAWCVPIDTAMAGAREIRLTDSNALCLTSVDQPAV